MPATRRALLRTAGTLLPAVGLAGCTFTSGPDTRSAEYLQLKAVTVSWRRDGRSYEDQLFKLLSDGESEIRGDVASEYAELTSPPTEITVSEDVHDELERAFETVRYGVGFCGDEFGTGDGHGCLNTGISRADFNRVQFGDRAEVTVVDNAFRIESVEEGDRAAVREWGSDVREYDWTERHSGRGRDVSLAD